MIKNIFKYLSLLLIAVLASASITYAATWAEPTAIPPGENRDTPINVGSLLQTKDGPLGIDTSPIYIRNNALIFTDSINDSGGRNVSIDKGASGDSYNIKLPNSKGIAGQALVVSNVSGSDVNLAFDSQSASGITVPNTAVLFSDNKVIAGDPNSFSWDKNTNSLKIKAGSGIPFSIADAGNNKIFNITATGTLATGSVPWARLNQFPTNCSGSSLVQGIGPGGLTCVAPTIGVNAGDGAILFQQGANPGTVTGNSTYLQWLPNGLDSSLRLGDFSGTVLSKMLISNKNSTKSGLIIRDDANKGALSIYTNSSASSTYSPLSIIDENLNPAFTVNGLGSIVNGNITWNQVTSKPGACLAGQVSLGFDSNNNHVLKCSKIFDINTGLTPGSVLFIGPGSLVAENNANFFWDDAVGQLKLYGSLDISDSNGDGTTGVIYFGGTPFINNLSGLNNLFIGSGTPYSGLGYASDVIGIGNNALTGLSLGTQTIAIGSGALAGSSRIKGIVAIGFSAGRNLNTIGSNSANTVIVGDNALITATASDKSIAIGSESLMKYISPSGNTAIGYQALRGNDAGTSAGAYVTAVGHKAGIYASSPNSVFIGSDAGSINNGSSNVFIGKDSGKSTGSGSYNTYLGASSGNVTTGNSNVFVGFGSGNDIANISNLFIIDNKARTAGETSANNALLYGQFKDSGDPYLRVNGRLEVNAGLKMNNYKALVTPSSNCVQTSSGWKAIHFFGGVLICERPFGSQALCMADTLADCCTALGNCY